MNAIRPAQPTDAPTIVALIRELDWNANAIAFYEKLGATVMPDWRICRVTGPGLDSLAGQPTAST